MDLWTANGLWSAKGLTITARGGAKSEVKKRGIKLALERFGVLAAWRRVAERLDSSFAYEKVVSRAH